jgi:hypothetical protein
VNREGVKATFRLAIENMFEEDGAQDPARPLIKTSERNITAHLRDHIHRVLHQDTRYRHYQVDHEYNRMGLSEEPKHGQGASDKSRKHIGPCPPLRNIVPDIAVHRRGITADKGNSPNLFVIEVKKISFFNGSPANIRNKKVKCALNRDRRKLRVLRDPSDGFRYQHTASLVFSLPIVVWVALDDSNFEILTELNS